MKQYLKFLVDNIYKNILEAQILCKLFLHMLSWIKQYGLWRQYHHSNNLGVAISQLLTFKGSECQ